MSDNNEKDDAINEWVEANKGTYKEETFEIVDPCKEVSEDIKAVLLLKGFKFTKYILKVQFNEFIDWVRERIYYLLGR